MPQLRTIKGIAVAPGLAIGGVHVVRASPDVVPTWTVPEEDIPREIERLHKAIDVVTEAFRERQRRVAAQAGEKDAEIFAVHRALLQDPSARTEVETRIREQRINSEASIQALIERFESTLSSLAGDSVRSYAADFSDPWREVLDVLLLRDREHVASGGDQLVVAAAQLTPQVVTFLERGRVLAVITETGGRFSHGAVLARSFGIPCVVGLPNLLSRLEQGLRVTVDGDRGAVQLRPTQEDVDEFLERIRRRRARVALLDAHAEQPAVTPDGRALSVQVNIESLLDLDTFAAAHTDGVGLLRTEFLYMERPSFPSEDEQYRLYRRIVEFMAGRPVTLRTLDIGNDKQLAYFRTPHEANPALGWRGLRITIEWQDLLRVQLSAALRASAHGPLRILLPMVTSLEEVLEVHRIFDEVRRDLREHGHEVSDDVPVGAMVEVPSALLVLPSLVKEVDFVSVGTNDLVQYLLAADRDNPLVAKLYDPYHPAVVQALQRVADVARQGGVPCAVCGEVAGDGVTALMLLGMGYDSVSVAPNFVTEIKHAVRRTSWAVARELAAGVLGEERVAGVRARLERARGELEGRLFVPAGGAPSGGPESGRDGER